MLKYIKAYLRKYRKECILAPAFKMLEAAFDLLVPLVVAAIINTGIAQGDSGYILSRCAILAGLAVVGLLCSVTAQYFAASAATGSAAGLRRDLFSHIQSLGFSEMDAIGQSTLITRMTGDINQVQNGVNMFLRLFLRSPFIVFGAVAMAFTISSRIAVIFAVAVPLLSAAVFGIMLLTSPRYKRNQARLDAVTRAAMENLSGVRVVRAFNSQERETARFSAINAGLASGQLRVGRLSALLNPLTYVIINLCIIAILNSGAVVVDTGALKSGDIIALVNYMGQILIELVKLANLIVTLSRAGASLNRVGAVLDTQPSMSFPEADAEIREDADAVRFEGVGLTYAGAGGESLSDISFRVARGQTVGVIGCTGSGKSSLVNLIPRFYDATSGKVYIFGQPVKELSREFLRSRIAIVPQRAQLFSGTVRQNLLWGNPSATDGELLAALEMAQAKDFVMAKPGGLDWRVEQGGRNLSGGQRQRLTVARALVKRPDILILDDSASALDYATDAALRSALRSLPDGTTVFIVSQRTSSIEHADLILVLDDGRLAGCGRQEELLGSCEVYAEIYESQFRKGDAR